MEGEGKVSPPGVLAAKAPRGGLHVKAGLLSRGKDYIVAKLNTNFPGNGARFGLPTIQGLIVVYNGENGSPLAVFDSIEITIKRTAAASAVAAKYLARKNSSIVTLIGCGQQAPAQLRALHSVLPLKTTYVFDANEVAAQKLAVEMAAELQIQPVGDLKTALQNSDICVTCTTAREFFIRREDIAPGTFIAAVGADDEHKQEIDPALMASAKIVADNLEQCCAIGDTHHAIAAGLMGKEDVYAGLSEIVSGRRPGRVNDDEIIIFDSTGVATEDAAAATLILEKALSDGKNSYFDFAA